MIDLTISIVSYNTAQYLQRCLASILDITHSIELEVIVVDNNSHDHTVALIQQQFPQVKVIANTDNRFFSRAHNQGLTQARGRYFLILNSDTQVPVGTLETLASFLDNHPGVGAVGCREMQPNGSVVSTGSTFSTPWIEMLERTCLNSIYHLRKPLWRYRIVDWARTTSRDLDVLTDCFLMVRTGLMQKLGGYDEQFLLYYTENDLCHRIWEAGYQVHFQSNCYYIHHGQRSTVQMGTAKYNQIYESDMLAYYKKHFGLPRTHLMQLGFLLVERVIDPLLKIYRHLRFGGLKRAE